MRFEKKIESLNETIQELKQFIREEVRGKQ